MMLNCHVIRKASHLGCPLSGWDTVQDGNGILVQFEDGVTLSNLVLDLDFRWQTLKEEQFQQL